MHSELNYFYTPGKKNVLTPPHNFSLYVYLKITSDEKSGELGRQSVCVSYSGSKVKNWISFIIKL